MGVYETVRTTTTTTTYFETLVYAYTSFICILPQLLLVIIIFYRTKKILSSLCFVCISTSALLISGTGSILLPPRHSRLQHLPLYRSSSSSSSLSVLMVVSLYSFSTLRSSARTNTPNRNDTSLLDETSYTNASCTEVGLAN